MYISFPPHSGGGAGATGGNQSDLLLRKTEYMGSVRLVATMYSLKEAIVT